jgi:hypothetical protein
MHTCAVLTRIGDSRNVHEDDDDDDDDDVDLRKNYSMWVTKSTLHMRT